MTHTNKSVLERFNVSDLSLEFPEAEVPVETGNQRQGDVMVVRVTTTHAGSPLGAGIRVVASENSPNTHTLNGIGLWEPNPRVGTDLVQGWLTVAAGDEAFLIHTEEHSALGIGEGTYEIRRQQEFAGEWRRVAD
jgi:hypothetical protein